MTNGLTPDERRVRSLNTRVLRLLEFAKVVASVEERCATVYGRERIRALHPLAGVREVEEALAVTEDGATIYRLKGAPPLPEGDADIRPTVQRVATGGLAGPGELLDVAIAASRARLSARLLDDTLGRGATLPALESLREPLSVPRELEDAIMACIDEDALVRDDASPELRRVRADIRSLQDRTRRVLDELVRSPAMARHLQDNIVTVRDDRYCLAVKVEEQQHVRGLIHGESASGATVFIEPERVLLLGNELRRLRSIEEREVERVLARLCGLVAEMERPLLAAAAAMGELDAAVAKARYARETASVRPATGPVPYLRIRGGRHPLLDPATVVPLDARLGGEFRILVITGPNTGGKTVALKTIGLFVVMAMSGLFVPADPGTEIGFFREVFADIGDEQSIEQSLSTFSSHMTQIVRILREADDCSLALFDEIGAGTDPTEGAALAIAILEHLRTAKVHTVATTHYTELKAYAHTTEGVQNASVEFDPVTLAPTYRLLMGVPGKSNAFAIARRLGLKDSILEKAESLLTVQDARVEDLIARLQASVIAAREEEEELRRARFAAQEAEQRWEHRMRGEEEDRERRRRRAEEEVRTYVRRAQREADEVLRELRAMRETGTPVKDHELGEARRKLEGLVPAHQLRASARTKKQPAVDPGDEVRVLALAGQAGTVIETVEGGRELLVAIGSMKMKVPKEGVELARKAPKAPAAAALLTRAGEHVMPSLDIRGSTIEEGIVELERYLDRALLAGYPQVTVIHGKGTGALRNGLQAYLRRHARVKGIRPGAEGEGGSGVTIVTLG